MYNCSRIKDGTLLVLGMMNIKNRIFEESKMNSENHYTGVVKT